MKVIKNESVKHNTQRNDRLPGVEQIQKLTELPKPAAWFKVSKQAKRIYKEVGTALLEQKGMRAFDYYTVLMLAVALDQYIWASSEIERKNAQHAGSGYVQKFATGAANISAELTVREKAHKQILELAAKFGLTLRDRLSMNQPQTDPNQIDIFGMFKTVVNQ